MDDEAERPRVRVTFERGVPMFRDRLTSELESEGLAAVSGPPPGEYRGGREVIDVVRVTLQVLGGVKVLEDTAESVEDRASHLCCDSAKSYEARDGHPSADLTTSHSKRSARERAAQGTLASSFLASLPP
jgi:hypothetical protein